MAYLVCTPLSIQEKKLLLTFQPAHWKLQPNILKDKIQHFGKMLSLRFSQGETRRLVFDLIVMLPVQKSLQEV